MPGLAIICNGVREPQIVERVGGERTLHPGEAPEEGVRGGEMGPGESWR